MKTTFRLAGTFTILIIILALVPACKKTMEPVKIAEWDRYQDPVYKMSFTYPKGWTTTADPGRIKVYSSAEAAEKFFDPRSNKQDGVEVIIARDKPETPTTLDAYMASYKKDLTASGFQVRSEDVGKLDGIDARSITFSGEGFDSGEGIRTEHEVFQGDLERGVPDRWSEGDVSHLSPCQEHRKPCVFHCEKRQGYSFHLELLSADESKFPPCIRTVDFVSQSEMSIARSFD